MGILCGQQFLLFQGDPQIAQGQVSVLDLLHELDAPLALLRQGFVVAADGQQAVQRQGVVRLGEGNAAGIVEGDVENVRLGGQILRQSLQLALLVLLDPARMSRAA
jgi:hypothetical protein